MTPSPTHRIRGLAAAGAVALALLIPAGAQAGALIADAPDCASQSLSQVFLPWADPGQYTLAAGGSFEPGAKHWTLNGASIVSGNEPFNVTSSSDKRSLSLPDGSSATSRAVCVNLGRPDIRFFASASDPSAVLSVNVLFEDAFGNVQSAPIGVVTGSSGWAPTAPMPILANLLPLLPGGYSPVSFSFTASGGDFQIDDIYVDPYMR